MNNTMSIQNYSEINSWFWVEFKLIVGFSTYITFLQLKFAGFIK